MATNTDNIGGEEVPVPSGSGADGTIEQKSVDAKPNYLTNKSNPEHTKFNHHQPANIEDFYFNVDAHNADDKRSVLGHVYDRIDKTSTPLSTGINNSKDKDQSYRDIITKIFKDKKTEHFKYGINIDDMHNEDPTILGFDLMIDVNNSPLFTELPDFFNAFAGISEIANRKEVYIEFIQELTKYFETSIPGSTGEFSAFKSHYIQGIQGLDLLVDSVSGGSFDEAGKKQFTDYGKDLLKFKLYEDVTLSTSHLAFLYKTLSWSRINGRLMIPENLLRFDMYVQISEIRNFNTVRKSLINNSGTELLSIVQSNVSRYVYKLYDCQFFFDKLPHSDSVDVSQNKATETFDVSIKYKFSTVQFERFMQQDDVINRAVAAGPNDLTNRSTDWDDYKAKNRRYITNEDIFPTSVNISGYGESSGTASDADLGNKAEFLIKKKPLELKPYIWFDVVGSTSSTREAAADSSSKSSSNTELTKKTDASNSDLEKLKNSSSKSSSNTELTKKTDASNSDLEKLKNKTNTDAHKQSIVDKLKTTVKKDATGAIANLKKASLALAKNQANKLIGLVNESFNKIINDAGLGKNITNPANVYDKVNPVEQLIKNQLKNFGNSTINSVLGLGGSGLKNIFKK